MLLGRVTFRTAVRQNVKILNVKYHLIRIWEGTGRGSRHVRVRRGELQVCCCIGSLFQSVLRDELVWGAVGCHPKHASDYTDEAEFSLRRMLRHQRVVALGEIGLDYSGT